MTTKIEAVRHVLWMNGDREKGMQPGGFITALLEAWARADWGNSNRLGQAFPKYGSAVDISKQFGTPGVRRLLEYLEAEEAQSGHGN